MRVKARRDVVEVHGVSAGWFWSTLEKLGGATPKRAHEMAAAKILSLFTLYRFSRLAGHEVAVQIVASLAGILALCLLHHFKGQDKNEEDWQSNNKYSLYKSPIFWVMLALLIGHIILGASLATAAIMRMSQIL